LIASLQEIGRLARVNLSNPAEFTTSYLTDAANLNYVSGIAMFGNYLFAAMYSTSNIVRVMVRDITTYKDFGAGNSSNRHVIEDGKYLYICNYTGNRISRQSLTDATDFTLNWATSTQGISSPGAMVLYNGYIYVFNKGSARTSIPKISITNPTTDFTTNWRSVNVDAGVHTFYADGACVYNNYLYISFGNQNSTAFKITRISMIDPTNDYTPNWFTPTYFCYSIIPYNGYLYAGVVNYGIGRISVADPNVNSSVITTKVFTTNIISALYIQGDSLYFSLFNSNAIGKISISNPSASRSTIEFVKDNTNLSGAFGIAARGSLLYAVSYNTTKLITIPISSENITLYKDFSTYPLYTQGFYITQYGDYMYIASYTNARMTRISLTNPSDITYSWAIKGTQYIDDVGSITAYNGYLYYVAKTSAATQYISRISITSPTTDYTSNWFSTTAGAGYYATCCSNIVNNYLYIAYNGATKFISRLNITNTSGDYTKNWASLTTQVGGMVAYGGFLYMGVTNSGIYRINLSNPGAGAVLWIATNNTLDINGLDVDVINNYLYAANTTGHVVRFLLSNPSSATNIPEFAGTDDTSIINRPSGLILNGNYVYGINYYNAAVFRVKIDLSIPDIICFKKDSRILTSKGYRKIQHLKKGDLVKTLNHGFRPIFRIGKKEIYHHPTTERSKEHLYRCSKKNYPDLFEDLVLTGCHSLLVDDYVDELQYRKTIEVNGATYVTEGKYRLPVCADWRASVYETAGKYLVYHIALENESYYGNYGIFANGLLVESTSKRFLEEDNIMETI
jgi:protein involved in ribonucleotide reduction